jgi:hypothetical protein
MLSHENRVRGEFARQTGARRRGDQVFPPLEFDRGAEAG